MRCYVRIEPYTYVANNKCMENRFGFLTFRWNLSLARVARYQFCSHAYRAQDAYRVFGYSHRPARVCACVCVAEPFINTEPLLSRLNAEPPRETRYTRKKLIRRPFSSEIRRRETGKIYDRSRLRFTSSFSKRLPFCAYCNSATTNPNF